MKIIFLMAAFFTLSTSLCSGATPAKKPEIPKDIDEALSAPAKSTAKLKGVSPEQWNNMVRYLKKVNERLQKVEAENKTLLENQSSPVAPAIASPTVSQPDAPNEEVVDLNSTAAVQVPSAASSAALSPHAKEHGLGVSPYFKVYFDLNLYKRPGVTPLTFDNFHSFLLFEITPTPEIQFSFDVNPTPRYYELDYQLTKRLQLRAGKIWIPFDDMAPHNIFGGRTNVSRLAQPSGAAFLPDLWTDLGVGVKYRLLEMKTFLLDTHLYVVNGFHSGGTDPKTPTAGADNYPSFADLSTSPDNNDDKGIGGRISGQFWRKLGGGISFYRGRWNNQAQSKSLYITMLGFDSQLRLGRTELRAGLLTMNVDLSTEDYNRGGLYLEAGHRFGSDEAWKVLARAGQLQTDDRVIDSTDQQLVGATVLYKPGLIQWSIEHSRDLKTNVRKRNYSFTNFRIVIAL